MQRGKARIVPIPYSSSESESSSTSESSSSSNDSSSDIVIVRKRGRDDVIVASPPIPRRRLPRQAATGLREAFQLLRVNNLDGFLNHWMICRDLSSAFDLLKNFGQGHRVTTVTALWQLHFQGQLFVRSLLKYRIRGTCCACNLGRSLKYCFYLDTPDITKDYFNKLDDQEDGDLQLLGIMGVHCYEVKFRALMALADSCLSLADEVDRPDFDQHARETLAGSLQRVREAPANMREIY